ncbi:PP2C family protein-serine/threonine phosphatase [Chondromyces apiculatus]|uniref:Stage II sporulation E family protein n=1 Tax=Chondromyces apiculatus DSM 436 TaxID=1192034 RepID=A0A017SXK4_9BACT|nr:GAF domain-containing SpoIIE family protein phosphatase [Chondromyces apiculatus]EYF01016.1 Stage II sporulation E family protein [Chondromyces apiculatus DSM 436]
MASARDTSDGLTLVERLVGQSSVLRYKLASFLGTVRARGVKLPGEVLVQIEEMTRHLGEFHRFAAEQHQVLSDAATREARSRALLEVSRAITSSLDMQTVLQQVLDQVIGLTEAARGYLVLLDERGELGVRVARNLDQRTLEGRDFAFSTSVIAEVIKTQRSIVTSDAREDLRFAHQNSVTMHRLTSIMAAPLSIQGRVIGVLYLDNPGVAGQFSGDDMELLEAFAAQAAIAIHNAQLFGQTDEALKARVKELEAVQAELAVARDQALKGLKAIEREMQVGQLIQAEFLPYELPRVSGWEIGARFLPARHLSGDFYDVFALPGERLALVIADVCDKGVAAALFMALMRGLIRTHAARASGDVLAIVEPVNEFVAEHHGRSAMFTTAFVGILDPASGELRYANCGHEAPLLVRAGGTLVRLGDTGPVLGAARDVEFTMGQVQVAEGDALVAFTDGVVDALSETEERFGEERFLQLAGRPGVPMEKVLERLEAALRAHVASAPPADDVTVLGLRRLSR